MNHTRGFTLVELMVAMVLGLMLLGGVLSVLVSTKQADRFNSAMAGIQEDGRASLSIMVNTIRQSGVYDLLHPDLDPGTDLSSEGEHILANAIVTTSSLAGFPEFSQDNNVDGNDQLTIALMGYNDCTGDQHDYDASGTDLQFHVVNRYFVENNTLMCEGFDGRILRGVKSGGISDARSGMVSLLNNVESFQVLYGIAQAGDEGVPSRYVTADRIEAVRGTSGFVVSVRFAILVSSDEENVMGDYAGSERFRLLNEQPITPTDDKMFKQFEHTVLLRNTWNRSMLNLGGV